MKLFRCERYGCRMTAHACAARQARAREESYESDMAVSLAPCLHCEQGRAMAAGIQMPKREWRPLFVIGRAYQERRIARQVAADMAALGLA